MSCSLLHQKRLQIAPLIFLRILLEYPYIFGLNNIYIKNCMVESITRLQMTIFACQGKFQGTPISYKF